MFICSLNTLEMFGCFSITANALTDISQHCKGLLTLNMGQCWKLSDGSISQLSASLGLVENLDVRGCKQVQDATVRQILLNCPRLRTLAIANIPDLTNESLVSIATLCPSIRCGGNSCCHAFLILKFHVLRSLDLCGCSGLTNTGIKVLAQSADSLTYLDLSSSKATNQRLEEYH
ncbi:hypothetical protein CAPTEDRAFT_92140 [Capitella teleta]|uniref:F-box/LRR-repeat protein 15-like leucin rich repeat domain-containing protein n=1 Tax=Capitella teleta TaxID=283909 RepID=R7TPX1_CAPTE|nr:hypothetical protein CAPTEDRAFT_92140 [Capitella teleta]|eukprot:ELT95928.1 hypothetical protein CAPTEDRAFT_92140 [Capitella teleta]